MRPSHAAGGLVIETQFADVTFLGYPISAKARFNYDPYDRILALTYLRQPHAGRGRHSAGRRPTEQPFSRDPRPGRAAGYPRDRGRPAPGRAAVPWQNPPCRARSRQAPSTRPGPSDAADAPGAGPPLRGKAKIRARKEVIGAPSLHSRP